MSTNPHPPSDEKDSPITAYSVKYDDDSQLTIQWPEIDKADTSSAVDSIVKAFVTGQSLGAGTSQEYVEALAYYGIDMTATDEQNGVEALIELGDTLAEFIGEFQEIEL